ncbi:MAG TPA: hypothetical protein VLQ45_20360 [Thermoanaerobaculia bacterium]|nr:hypothetical protein [Thermoanaerobaculia bacterium]
MTRRLWWIAAPLTAVLSLSVLSPAAATVAPLSAPELAAASPHVVVAVVEDAGSRWDRSLIVTDYSLRIEERLRGDAPGRVTISIPGGTVGGETQETSVSFPLEVGARYLLFLGDLERPTLTPVTGAWQGAFREDERLAFSETVDAARALVAWAEGKPVPTLEASAASQPAPSEAVHGVEKYTLATTLASPPLAFNVALPADSPFFPAIELQLAKWNVYAGNLFQRPPTTGEWRFGNGVSDFAGFPNDAQMTSVLGRTWSANSISFSTSRIVDGRIVESDIAFNPAQRWTLDAGEATRPGAPFLFQDSLLVALGFSWGLRNPFEVPGRPFDFQEVQWDSVLNFKEPQYHLATLFADDVAAARDAFGGTSLRDGVISSYTTQRSGTITPFYTPAVPTPSSVRPGAKFNLSKIKIENTGTVPLAKPTVEVYLTPSRFSLAGAILVKRLRASGTIPSGGVLNVTPGKVTVPARTPAGTYFLAFVLKDAKDVFQENNRAWSNYNVTVRVVR